MARITQKKGAQSGNKKSITVVNQETRNAAYLRTKNSRKAAEKYGVSIRTIQRWKKSGRIPKKQTGLLKTAKRAGKKAFYAEKQVSIKKAVEKKYDRLIRDAQREADSVSGVAKRAKNEEVQVLREAKRIAKESTLEELVGMTGDLRTDSDWREWEANYNAVKGVLFA